jgi:hypothetical protein
MNPDGGHGIFTARGLDKGLVMSQAVASGLGRTTCLVVGPTGPKSYLACALGPSSLLRCGECLYLRFQGSWRITGTSGRKVPSVVEHLAKYDL